MRVSIRWLKELVDLDGVGISTEELAERLTLAGLEVGAIEKIPHELSWEGIVVGEIVGVEPHPNADRLVIAHVDWGEGPVPSVTGAPNVTLHTKGVKVAVALPGAQIVNAYQDEPPRITVRTAKIRGAESKAVICSEKELGLSDDHTGVLLLDEDAPVGTPLVELLGDEVLEIELTPNLGRCLSMVGVAREVAALTGAKLNIKEPRWRTAGEDPSAEEWARVVIEDPELCPRYIAAIIRDIHNGQAPFWMRYRLLLYGMRPISLLVDITNYVMLEWGQPLHAFDYDKLKARVGGKKPTILVRRAKPGERITTLDGVERPLDEEMLLICDEAGPIAIAGVMGGLDTEVDENTRNVLLESASFHAINNRRTAQKLQLLSEASLRFSRGVPPELPERGAVRAAELMRALGKGAIAQGLVDAYPGRREPTVVAFSPQEVERLLGMSVEPKEIRSALERLGFQCRRRKGGFDVAVPYWRLDVGIPADLVEEVARLWGYDKLPATLMNEPLPPQRRNRSLELEERVRDILTGLGFVEVIHYSLTSPESVAKLQLDEEAEGPFVELANPISRERRVLRRTLMNLLLETVERNQRHRERVAVFELGRVFLPEHPDTEGLPQEPRRLGIALAGRSRPLSWADKPRSVDFYDLKGAIAALLSHLGVGDETVRYVPVQRAPFHPGRAAELVIRDHPVGVLGEVHPLIAERFDLRGRAYLAELDLEALLAHVQEDRVYAPIPRFPGIRLDLAAVLPEGIPAERVERVIREHGGAWLREVVLFDVYKGDPVPEGHRSLAYALFYQSEEKTLTDEEAQGAHRRVIEALQRELGAQVRGLEV